MSVSKITGDGEKPAASASVPASDARYTFDPIRLSNLRSSAPWKDNPRYFTAAAISPTAAMKMLSHCHSGVEKGLRKGGNPIEVMGLMLGRPDPDATTTLVVTDVFPLPIEGFETVSVLLIRRSLLRGIWGSIRTLSAARSSLCSRFFACRFWNAAISLSASRLSIIIPPLSFFRRSAQKLLPEPPSIRLLPSFRIHDRRPTRSLPPSA